MFEDQVVLLVIRQRKQSRSDGDGGRREWELEQHD